MTIGTKPSAGSSKQVFLTKRLHRSRGTRICRPSPAIVTYEIRNSSKCWMTLMQPVSPRLRVAKARGAAENFSPRGVLDRRNLDEQHEQCGAARGIREGVAGIGDRALGNCPSSFCKGKYLRTEKAVLLIHQSNNFPSWTSQGYGVRILLSKRHELACIGPNRMKGYK